MRPAAVVMAFALWSDPAPAATQVTLDPDIVEAVKRLYPVEMRNPRREVPERTCLAGYSSTGASKLVAAAYTNGDVARLTLLTYTKKDQGRGVATKLSEVTEKEFALGGYNCELDIVDLSDPSAKAVSALARTIKLTLDGAADWYFIWDGTQLRNIGALDPPALAGEPPRTALRHSDVVDVDLAGPKQIVGIAAGAYDRVPGADGILETPRHTLFRFDGSQFAAARTFQYWRTFNDQRPTPHTWNDSIGRRGSSAPFTLILLNGTRSGKDRVSSVRVVVNGAEVVPAGAMGTERRSLKGSLTLGQTNSVEVTTAGSTSSVLYLMIEAR